MKTIEELGISPAPWRENKWQSPDDYGHDVQDAHRNLICEMFLMQGGSRTPNARLIAAAPKLYSELWKICFGDCGAMNCRKCKGAELGKCSSCPLGGARAALAEASGVDFCFHMETGKGAK